MFQMKREVSSAINKQLPSSLKLATMGREGFASRAVNPLPCDLLPVPRVASDSLEGSAGEINAATAAGRTWALIDNLDNYILNVMTTGSLTLNTTSANAASASALLATSGIPVSLIHGTK